MKVPTRAEFDRAAAALMLTQVDGEEPEIGPMDDIVSKALATYLVHLIDANPALHRHLHALLDAAPPINGVRMLPVAALLPTLQATAVTGRKATLPEVSA